MTGKNVARETVDERERELRAVVLRAGGSAVELFGDAQELAEDDAAELVTATDVVRTGEGGGLRSACREVGDTLLGVGAVSVVLLAIRSGWRVDVDVALVLVAVSVAVLIAGVTIGRTLFAAGMTGAMTGVLSLAGVLAAVGIATAASMGTGHIAVHDAPVLVLAVGMLAPGIAVRALGSLAPRPALREDWDDARWLERFRGGLRARLVPAAVARGHVAEIAASSGSGTASAEFGHPLVLARELADADRTARMRRWWVSIVTGTGIPLVVAAMVVAGNGWGAWTIPVAVLLMMVALISLLLGWSARPRGGTW
ncbi:MAG: hypothetical protein ACK4UY_05480 [Dietzia sp.]